MKARKATAADGFSLAELMVGLFLMSIGALAVAPLFMHAMHGNQASRDMGWVGVAVEQRVEALRSQSYNTLLPGGSVNSDVTGYTDNPEPDVRVRWSIVDNAAAIPGTKIITVRGFRVSSGDGPRAAVTTITLRGQ